jgi:TorA maturation chaperone TorD
MLPAYDVETAAARADFCRLLAACYYQPGPEYAEERVFESMTDAAGRIDAALATHARRLGEAFSAEGIDSLLVDYTRLFLGPVSALAKPYESVWRSADGPLVQDPTATVRAMYEKCGFQIDERFRELPDHIAAELEFLYLLIFREARARRVGEADAVAMLADVRGCLLGQHLGLWIGPFTAAVRTGARSAFYRELAECTNRFITLERTGSPA